jgi:hypothetical protein
MYRVQQNSKVGNSVRTMWTVHHYSCGNVKTLAAEREKWKCDTCRTEKVKMLKEELQNVLQQIDELKARNRELEEELLLVEDGKRTTVPGKQKVAKWMVGNSLLRSFGAEHADMKVRCFLRTNTEQLYRVIERRDLGSPATFIIHVGANYLRKTRNVDFVLGEVYALLATTKKKFPNCTLVLSGVLQRRDVSWRRIGTLNMIDSTA